MVYEGRRKRRGGSGCGWRVCVWLLILVAAAWVVLPGTMRELRDRAAGALGLNIDSAVRAFNEARDGGAGILDAAGASVRSAFGAEDRIPASDIPSDGDGSLGGEAPAMAETDELAGLPLPKYVSGETPELPIKLERPVDGQITSPFGYRRDGTGEAVFHYGADIAAAGGAPVRAMASGEVMAVGDSTTYGRYVIISHEGGVETICAHLGETRTAGGETVEAGQEIGAMGSGEEGAYLHLELIVDGMYVDPAGYIE